MKRNLCGVAIALLGFGCGSDSHLPESVSVRDSAGVRIIQSASPTGQADSWVLSASPVVTIGLQDGPDEVLLHRVYAALMLDSGEVLVSNSGTHEVRTFSADGTFLHSFGRDGEGPGEFSGFSSMRMFRHGPDSVAVTDGSAMRVNIFSLRGDFGHSISPTLVEGFGRPSVWGVFDDGRWLTYMPVGTGILEGNVGEVIRSSFAHFAHAPDGATARRLAEVEGRPRVVNSLGGGAIHFPYVPLTPSPVFSLLGNDLLLSQGQEPEFKRISPEGAVLSVIRWSQPRREVSEIWSRFGTELLAGVNEDRRPAYSRLLTMDGLPVPDQVPSVAEIRPDVLGFVWVQEYRLPWEQEPVWNVFDPDGFWIGAIRTPPRVRICEIGGDYILGRHLDELGVERIVVYSLDRGEAS